MNTPAYDATIEEYVLQADGREYFGATPQACEWLYLQDLSIISAHARHCPTDPRTSAERTADAEWTATQQYAADVRQELHE